MNLPVIKKTPDFLTTFVEENKDRFSNVNFKIKDYTNNTQIANVVSKYASVDLQKFGVNSKQSNETTISNILKESAPKFSSLSNEFDENVLQFGKFTNNGFDIIANPGDTKTNNFHDKIGNFSEKTTISKTAGVFLIDDDEKQETQKNAAGQNTDNISQEELDKWNENISQAVIDDFENGDYATNVINATSLNDFYDNEDNWEEPVEYYKKDLEDTLDGIKEKSERFKNKVADNINRQYSEQESSTSTNAGDTTSGEVKAENNADTNTGAGASFISGVAPSLPKFGQSGVTFSKIPPIPSTPNVNELVESLKSNVKQYGLATDLEEIVPIKGIASGIQLPNIESSLKIPEFPSFQINGPEKVANKEVNKTPEQTKAEEKLNPDNYIKPINGKVPRSYFNEYALFAYRGSSPLQEVDKVGSADYRYIPESNLTEIHDVSTIINECRKKAGPAYQYKYGDFALLKHLGTAPLNQMITLRRFSHPVEDTIITKNKISGSGKGAKRVLRTPDIARAVTFLGEEFGNPIGDVLNFSWGYNTDEITSEIHTQHQGGNNSKFASMMSSDSMVGNIARTLLGGGISPVQFNTINQRPENFDPMQETYGDRMNTILGPYNVVNKMLVRSTGITFENEIKLKFRYTMRGSGYGNPKAMFLDNLANFLALTYNNAPFWGGENRVLKAGGAKGLQKGLGSLNKLEQGDLLGYGASVLSDLNAMLTNSVGYGFQQLWSNMGEAIANAAESIKDGNFSDGFGHLFGAKAVGVMGKVGTNLIGAKAMEWFNKPEAPVILRALLTGEATGSWHLTIGNPLNPIITMGNLMLTDTNVKFDGPFGLQDFPTEVEFEVTLRPGRPRDKAEIESMFNGGQGRLYFRPKGAIDIDASTTVSGLGKNKTEGGTPVKGVHNVKRSDDNIKNTVSYAKVTMRTMQEDAALD